MVWSFNGKYYWIPTSCFYDEDFVIEPLTTKDWGGGVSIDYLIFMNN